MHSPKQQPFEYAYTYTYESVMIDVDDTATGTSTSSPSSLSRLGSRFTYRYGSLDVELGEEQEERQHPILPSCCDTCRGPSSSIVTWGLVLFLGLVAYLGASNWTSTLLMASDLLNLASRNPYQNAHG
jgi:hypothetical protein